MPAMETACRCVGVVGPAPDNEAESMGHKSNCCSSESHWRIEIKVRERVPALASKCT